MTSIDNTDSPNAAINHAPLEFPPAIDPIFWGTSDLLVWEAGNLLDAIDKEQLFRKIWAMDTLSDEEYNRIAAGVFEPLFIELSHLLRKSDLVVPRGFYGFFPVISDKTTIVVLDPSDFHTELFIVPCPPAKMLGGRSLADFYRPEGDILAISALTLGPHLDNHIKNLESDVATAKKAGFLRGLALSVVETLSRKMEIEVRRGLGIDITTGCNLPFRSGAIDAVCEAPLFEILGFEERLGIFASGVDRYSPIFSEIKVMAHHPQINDFIHFGTR